MLYPQNNQCRQKIELGGIWELKSDLDDQGIEKGYKDGFSPETKVGVPGSWNEQLSELGLMDYVGKVWYQKEISVPELHKERLLLRFGSVDFYAKVWINGNFVGEHQGGYLPFEFDITEYINQGKNRIVMMADNTLTHDTIPQGLSKEDHQEFDNPRKLTYPPTVFDFFAYGGIQRPVRLVRLGEKYLKDIKIDTDIQGEEGIVKLNAMFNQIGENDNVQITLLDDDNKLFQKYYQPEKGEIRGEFKIDNCTFWTPDNPYLYKLDIQLYEDDELVDEYIQKFGVRTVDIDNGNLFLNGEPIFLKGFGKHEDFPVLGKGLSYPLIIKDFQLMNWLGANSFRTSHYPYSEEIMQMADEMGFLVIDEVPAVSLNFKYVTDETLKNHKKALKELVDRDYNHPSVIMWSVANEPGIWKEKEAKGKKGRKYWNEIFEYANQLDTKRPKTLPACAFWGLDDLAYEYSDIISLNRYWGWYEIPGDVVEAGVKLKKEINAIHDKYNKPILLTEFGADTIAGAHSTIPEMFTEEYQTDLIEQYFKVIEGCDFTIGEHIWNFADFKTAQHYRRVILNRKGVFTRDRSPKSVAFHIRKHWLKN